MSQEETSAMLTAVAWANNRLARLGLDGSACIVHSFGAARMLSVVTGRELLVVEDGDGTAMGSIILLMERFEHALCQLLN
jgi:hypothetical protein